MGGISEMRNSDIHPLVLVDLQHFVQAVEHGSLTAAATAMGVAQSALTRHLSRLEATFGGRLLSRTGRGVALTELGRQVLPRARTLLTDARLLVEDASGSAHRPSGVVNVGILPSLTYPLVGLLFATVRARFPEIHLRVHEAYSGQIEVMLSEGVIDVGTYNRYRPLQRARQDAVLSTSLCLITAPGGPNDDKPSVRFAALADLPLVMPLRPNSLRALFEDLASQRRMPVNVVLEVSSAAAMLQAVVACDLNATLPRHAVRDGLQRGLVRAIPITHPTLRQTTYVDTTRRRPASPAVMEVTRLLTGLARGLEHPS